MLFWCDFSNALFLYFLFFFFFYIMICSQLFFFFFFNDTATTEIYTLSLHDALPICGGVGGPLRAEAVERPGAPEPHDTDRKSTRLNSSHGYISYAVFCLKKKKKKHKHIANVYIISTLISTADALLNDM